MFISFAGLRGSGKTTQSQLLSAYLNERGHQSRIAKAFDDEMKRKFVEMIPSNSEMVNHFLFCLLYRRQVEKIKELLLHDIIVVADRYIEYFMFHHKYYGLLKTHPPSAFNLLKTLVFEELMPNVVIFLNVDPLTANSRIKGRILKKERLDNMLETEENHKNILDFYQSHQEGLSCIKIDASPGPLEVLQCIVEALKQKTNLAIN